MKEIIRHLFSLRSGALRCTVVPRRQTQQEGQGKRSKQTCARRRRGLQESRLGQGCRHASQGDSNLDHKYAPDLATVYQQRGYASAKNQQFQEAVNDYTEALKIKSNDPRIYEQRAAVGDEDV